MYIMYESHVMNPQWLISYSQFVSYARATRKHLCQHCFLVFLVHCRFISLRTQTYFRLSLVSAENNVCEPEPGNDFCDVGILSQSQFSSSNPRTTARGIRCEEHSSFILSWNLIGQGETKVITSQKSFPGSSSQTLFSAETSDSRKYVCIRRLSLYLLYDDLTLAVSYIYKWDPSAVLGFTKISYTNILSPT